MMRTHRVGTITLGCMLIVFGALLMLHLLLPVLSYGFIFSLWPVILIMLGIEVLIANVNSQKVNFIYDKGAVFLMVLLSFFAVFMAMAENAVRYHRFII